MRIRRGVLIVSAIAVVIAGSATAVALSGSGSSPVPRGAAPSTVQATSSDSGSASSSAAAQPSSVPAAVAARFGVLRRAATAQDTLTGPGASVVADQGGNVSLARRVVGGASPHWLVPASDGNVCAVASTGATGCQTAASIASEGTIGSTECGPGVPADKMVVWGVVPDGVDTVTLTSKQGSTQVPVSDNGWTTTVVRTPEDARPYQASWADGGTAHDLAVPTSPDVNQDCG